MIIPHGIVHSAKNKLGCPHLLWGTWQTFRDGMKYFPGKMDGKVGSNDDLRLGKQDTTRADTFEYTKQLLFPRSAS
jgi:hypothetical protein